MSEGLGQRGNNVSRGRARTDLDAELLVDLVLDGEPVAVPSEAALDVEALLVGVPRDNVLHPQRTLVAQRRPMSGADRRGGRQAAEAGARVRGCEGGGAATLIEPARRCP